MLPLRIVEMSKRFKIAAMGAVFISLTWAATGFPEPQQRPALIRDTDTAEGKEEAEAEKPKEYNPLLATQNLNVGNFYYKKKNYQAAIQRYLEAIAYQPGFVAAYEALVRTYDKEGTPSKTIQVLKDFISKNPDSPKARDFRARLAKLEKPDPGTDQPPR
jgi:tetratricopeptide (TPR) repeat protein